MRHRSQIEMIDGDESLDTILTQCLASPHTRLPIYRGDSENILGVIHAKDLLREMGRLVRGADGSLAALADLDILRIAMPGPVAGDDTGLPECDRALCPGSEGAGDSACYLLDAFQAQAGLATL